MAYPEREIPRRTQLAMGKSSPETTQARVYRLVRRDLAAGQYVPGEALSIRRLSERFDVSATPVREALRTLEAEYVLVRGKNRALVVPQLTMRELKDTQKIRSAIEGLAAEMAAERATDAEIRHLGSLVDAMRDALLCGDVDRYLGKNWEFHQSVYAAAKSDLSSHIIDTLWLRSGPYIRPAAQQAVRSGLNREHPMACHQACLDGIRARNPEMARKAIQSDIEVAATELFAHLEVLLMRGISSDEAVAPFAG